MKVCDSVYTKRVKIAGRREDEEITKERWGARV